MGRRMKGEGGVTQRTDGRWQATLELGWGPDGKRRRRTIYGRTQREAVVKLAAERRALAQHGGLPTGATTLAAWLERWLTDIAGPRVKPTTLRSYRALVASQIAPRIGRHRLDRLAAQHVRQMGADIARERSSSTALKAHAVLSKALEDARREGLVTRNVAEDVDRPRRAVSDREALSVPDAARILATVAHDGDAARWGLALLVGMRQGECLGLTWEHVDLDGGTLTVAWQVQRLPYAHGCSPACGHRFAGDCPHRTTPIPAGFEARHLNGGLWLTRPKSRAGWRRFPLPDILAAELTKIPGRDGLVFTRADGRPLDPGADSRRWHAILARAGLPPAPLHVARHTTASLLKAAGCDDLTIMSIMGHAEATTTHGYITQDAALQRRGLESVAGLLTGG